MFVKNCNWLDRIMFSMHNFTVYLCRFMCPALTNLSKSGMDMSPVQGPIVIRKRKAGSETSSASPASLGTFSAPATPGVEDAQCPTPVDQSSNNDRAGPSSSHGDAITDGNFHFLGDDGLASNFILTDEQNADLDELLREVMPDYPAVVNDVMQGHWWLFSIGTSGVSNVCISSSFSFIPPNTFSHKTVFFVISPIFLRKWILSDRIPASAYATVAFATH